LPALDRLASASLRVQNGGKAREVLHISALPTFAMRWLIPRLPEFQREHPALETLNAPACSMNSESVMPFVQLKVRS
jgi:DNA-binding transcriptional LysR family regulator